MMPLAEVLATYSDGDERGWDVEFAYLRERHADRLRDLRTAVAADGITEPVLLGSDGRIWDGHHRLCVAYELGIDSIPVRHSAEKA